jgi:hypothetical protein
VNFTVDQLRACMDFTSNIRNMSVIGASPPRPAGTRPPPPPPARAHR